MGYFEKFMDSLGNLSLKHGIGSPGSTAKVLAKTYLRIKDTHPDNTQSENLLSLVYNRRSVSIKLGLQDELCYMSEWHIKDIVDECLTQSSPLCALCVQMIEIEFRKKLDKIRGSQNSEVYYKMLDIIKEVVEKYAPGEI